MKEVELKLIGELMKNSRRSDRELAKAIGVSQPTVSRMVKKLEQEGYIKEYSMLPDFRKLGFELLALIFVKLRKSVTPEEAAKAREVARKDLAESTFGVVMLERGIGLGYDGVIIAYYKDYSSYVEHKNFIKKYPFVEFSESDAFLINLSDKVRYRPLTFSHLANTLLVQR
jgi:DNA-binding Lrp family transcriptional regulator